MADLEARGGAPAAARSGLLARWPGVGRRDVVIGLLVVVLSYGVVRRSVIMQAGDSQYSMLLSENLLRHRDFTLDRYHLRDPDYRIEDALGHRYYSFPPGSSILSVPLVALLHLRGLSAVRADGSYDVVAEREIDARLAATLTGLFAGLIYFMARLVLRARGSLLVAALIVFGTQVFSTTARAMWSDTWGILLVGAAVLMLLEAAVKGRAPPMVLLGTLGSWAYIVRPTNALPLAAMAVYVALSYRWAAWRLAVAVAGWLGLFVLYSWRHFHTFLPRYYAADRLRIGSVPGALAGNLISPSRGFLVYVPAVVAVALLLAWHWRAVRFRGLALLAAAVIVAHLAMLSGFGHWWGGHCYGARLTGSLVPWVALLAIVAFDAVLAALVALAGARDGAARAGRAAAWLVLPLAGLLCAASVFINGVGGFSEDAARWNSVPQDIDKGPDRLWSWRRPQFLAPFVEPPGPFPPLPPEGAQLAAETSNAFVGLGWAYPADSYRWTDGTHASLRFAAPAAQPGVLEIQMRPYLEGPLREQTVTVSLNGRSLQTFVLRAPEMATFEVPVPSGLIAAENTLRLDLPQATRPSSLGRSRDRRVLGVAVHSVRWSVGATALAR
jgi:hypothetical protein